MGIKLNNTNYVYDLTEIEFKEHAYKSMKFNSKTSYCCNNPIINRLYFPEIKRTCTNMSGIYQYA